MPSLPELPEVPVPRSIPSAPLSWMEFPRIVTRSLGALNPYGSPA